MALPADVNGPTSSQLPLEVMKDLEKSGLSTTTILAAKIHLAQTSELPQPLGDQLNVLAYKLPYFDVRGKLLPQANAFRARVLLPAPTKENKVPKYVQQRNSPPRAYVPPSELVDPAVWRDPTIPIHVTEGEKKALKASQEGFPTIGLGGAQSWRQRTYQIPESAIVGQNKDTVTLKLKAGADEEGGADTFDEVVQVLTQIAWHDRIVYLTFDEDEPLNEQVQSSVFEFALWLYEQGANPLQVRLVPPKTSATDREKIQAEPTSNALNSPSDPLNDSPSDSPPASMPVGSSGKAKPKGLDDFLVAYGPKAYKALLPYARFPSVPNIGSWVTKQIRSRKKSPYKIARAVLADLDKRGQRFAGTNGLDFYYLDKTDGVLFTVGLSGQSLRDQRNNDFGRSVIERYRIPTTESDVLHHVGDQFATLRPITRATPRKVSWADSDCCYVQLSDSTSVRVSASGYEVCDNGTGALFFADVVKPVRPSDVLAAAEVPVRGLWVDALMTLNLQAMPTLSIEQTRLLLAALFHMSPWLRRWRGMMLPIEQCIAEPNSGKSFLYSLRRGIMTGSAQLDHLPNTIRDWQAGITSAPALWVGDNLNDLPRELRIEMENEVARLVTDPEPHISMRALYSNNQLVTHAVDAVFAITAIKTPFHKPDIAQRSIMFNLAAVPPGQRDSMWFQRKMRQRTVWLGEQLAALRNFFALVEERWDEDYKSGHRLVHFEQSLGLMILAIGGDEADATYISKQLHDVVSEDIAVIDPVIEALREFGKEWVAKHGNDPKKLASAQDIIDWAQDDIAGRYAGLGIMKNVIILGKYVRQFEQVIRYSAGLEVVTRHNQRHFRVHVADNVANQ